MKNDVLVAFIVFQAVFFFLDIYILTKTNRDIARKGEYTFFYALVAIHMAYLILNSTWSLQEYDALHLSTIGMRLLCTGALCSVSGCAFSFFLFTTEKIQFAPMRKRAVRRLSSIPFIVAMATTLCSPWTAWIFRLSDENRMLQGPLYPVLVIASSLYLVAVVLIAGYNAVMARTRVRRRSSSALLFSVLLIIVFVILDDMLSQASILPVAIFAVILVIFISMQESNINSDALTGMNNRRKANDYLADRLCEVSPENPLYLYIGDLNGFKSINDIYGHLEGDAALILCSDALKHTISHYNGFAARFGGDEFLMSWQPDWNDHRNPEMLIEEVNRRLSEQVKELKKPYSLTMSLGYTRCTDKTESLGACIKRADEMLYRRKQAFYGSQRGAGRNG